MERACAGTKIPTWLKEGEHGGGRQPSCILPARRAHGVVIGEPLGQVFGVSHGSEALCVVRCAQAHVDPRERVNRLAAC